MKQTARLMIISLLVTSISLNTTISKAETTCKDVIKKCDIALEKKEEEIKATNDALTKSKDYNVMLDTQVKEAEEKLNAWYRNPLVLIGLGLLGGVAAGAVLIRR